MSDDNTNQKPGPNQDLKDDLERITLQNQINDLKNPKAVDPELKLLQSNAEIVAQQKAIVEGQKAIAEAQKATIETAFPKGALPTLEGDIKVDDKFGYAAVPVAYQAIKENAVHLADAIRNHKADLKADAQSEGISILIVNDLDFASGDIPLIQVTSGITVLDKRISDLQKENQAIINPPTKKAEEVAGAQALTGGEIGGTVSGILSTVSEIIGYFQVNYEIKGQVFSIETQALQAIVAGRIAEDKDLKVFINNFGIIEKSELVQNFNKLLGSKEAIDQDIGRLTKLQESRSDELKTAKEKLEKLEKPPGKTKKSGETEIKKGIGAMKTELQDLTQDLTITVNTAMPLSSSEVSLGENQENKGQKEDLRNQITELNGKVKAINTAITNSQDLIKSIVAFAESVTKSMDEKTLPLLAKAAVRKQIHDLGISHLLYLKILSSGGEAMTLKSRLTSGETAFIGGAVFSFVLATKKGIIRASDVFPVLSQLNYSLSDDDERCYQNVCLKRRRGTMGRFKRFMRLIDGSKTEEIKEDMPVTETPRLPPSSPAQPSPPTAEQSYSDYAEYQ